MMFWLEIILLGLLFFIVYKYQRDWIPVRPSFYQKGELVKIGHRGASALAPENTVASFTKAVETGMNGIELDVQFSADKQLVVYHNWDIEYNSGKIELIENLTYSDIQKISLNGNEKNKIPLFTEVLDKLELRQPTNGTAASYQEASKIAEKIGYPVVVRPS